MPDSPSFRPLKPRPPGARKRQAALSSFARATPVTHGYVKSFDGTKLFYSVEGQGRPLIFCYGLVCSSLHWTYQIEHFQKSHRAVWFDYRGHQNSEVPKDPSSLTLESISKDLLTVLDALEIQEAVFLGHSMGVNAVLEFYRHHPKRVAGMVLANGTAKSPLENLFRHNASQAGYRFLRRVYEKSPQLVTTIWKLQKKNPLARTLVALGGFNPHLTPSQDIEMYVDQVIDMDPSVFIELIGDYERYDATSWLHTVRAPTLIVAGEHDKLTPVEQQELMAQLIPNSRMEIIRHGSHCPQMDLPDLVNLKIERFLEELNYGQEPSRTRESASRSTAPHPDPVPEESV